MHGEVMLPVCTKTLLDLFFQQQQQQQKQFKLWILACHCKGAHHGKGSGLFS